MNQPSPLYDTSSALALLDPWLRKHLPDLHETARRRFIQLVSGIFEQRSLLLEHIAEGSAFQANDESNATQVRRIIRDQRLTLQSVYYPFIASVLAQLPGDVVYVTLDQTSHHTDYNLVQVGLATDGISLPLGVSIYDTDAAWAEDARSLLQHLNTLIPERFEVVLLADRVHTGEPFLSCVDTLGWWYVFRAPSDTLIEHPKRGWMPLSKVYKRANVGRYLSNIRVWKGGNRRANVSIYKLVRKGFRTVTWYVISDLPACKERFATYACRWWQECTFKCLKSGMFDWERGRVCKASRVYVLLMACGCAMWALWLLGRTNERVPKRKPTTSGVQQRRRNVFQVGAAVFRTAFKRKQVLVLSDPPAPRVLSYSRVFSPAQPV